MLLVDSIFITEQTTMVQHFHYSTDMIIFQGICTNVVFHCIAIVSTDSDEGGFS